MGRCTRVYLDLASIMTLTLALGLALSPSPARAQEFHVYYIVTWKPPRDGHFKAWWTKDGIRVTATPANPEGTPCVDTDVFKGEDITFSTTHKPGAINDHDYSFKAASQVSSGKVTAYSLPDLATLFNDIVRAVSWFTFWDPLGSDVDVTVELEAWMPHFLANPPTEPGGPFIFLGGTCPELPGFFARNPETDTPYEGSLMAESLMTLALVEVEGSPFLRGDGNLDGVLDISDPIFTLTYLFLGGVSPRCMDALDSNDSGEVDISDPVWSLSFLFTGGPPPPNCHPGPGPDPSPDELDCAPAF